MIRPVFLAGLVFALVFSAPALAQPNEPVQWITIEGEEGPGKGKHIVFVSGDEEYRSEEALPMLAKLLAIRHGFRCTVLFAIDPETGTIDPNHNTNIPGLHLLGTADLMVLFTRFRELPDDQMKWIVDYTNSGKPIIGLRTATHAFLYERNRQSPYAKYSNDSEAPGFEGGYGRQVLGERWVDHHGEHGTESTRGLVNGLLADHPILRGVSDVWAPTDVYAVSDITGDEAVLLFGQVLRGMEPTSPPNYDKSIMPVAWIKTYTGETGQTSRVFTTTMGAAVDFQNEDLRRLIVNAAYWAVGLEDQIDPDSDVSYVGTYEPTWFGFDGFRTGMRPSDYAYTP